jgi:hypothetical protein
MYSAVKLTVVTNLIGFGLILLTANAAPPANDTCAGRQTIPPNGPFPYKTLTVDISGATTTDDPPFGATCPSVATNSVWYEFRPQASGLYTLSTCAEAGTATTVADTVMAIYTDSGTPCSGYVQRACEDDVCGASGLQAAITTQLTANTIYYVVVWRWGDDPPPASTNAQLQLIVSFAQRPPNDLCSTPTELPLNRRMQGSTLVTANDYQLPGPVAAGRDVVYGFTAPENGTYSFAVREYGGNDLILYATTNCPGGTAPITVSNVFALANRNPASRAEELYCLSLSAGQRILIFVDENDPTEGGSTFSIEATKCARESEPNNSQAAANVLPCGVEGSIAPSGDVDYYGLGTFPAGYRAFAIVDAAAGNTPEMTLRAETTDEVLEMDSGDNDEAFGQFSSNLAGTILSNTPTYLRVSYIAGNTNEPYRLYAVVRPPLETATAETEPNNTIGVADPGTYMRGALTSGDEDFFSFSVAAGDILFVSLDGDPLRDGTRIQAQLALLNSGGTVLLSVDDLNQLSYPPGEAFVYRVNDAGTYFVRVMASTGVASTGDYLLSIARNCFVNNGTNSTPALTNLSATSPVSEGNVLTLRGNVLDPDAGEAFQLTVNWGDGSPNTVTNLAAGVGVFEIDHTVLDDPPSGTAADNRQLTLTVTDRFGASNSATVNANLRNVAPSELSIAAEPAMLNEGASLSLSAAFIDPGVADTFSITIVWGDGQTTVTNLSQGVRLVQAPHIYRDNVSSVTVIVTDDDGGSVTNSAPLTVNNVNPTLSNIAATSPIPGDGTTTLTGNFGDAGTADSFTLTVNWGDGTTPQNFNYPAGANSFNLQHQYALAGTNVQIALTLRDDDNGTATASTGVTIGPRNPNAARFLSISNAPNVPTVLRLMGAPNVAYRIQGSSNFQSWATLGSRTAGADGRFSFDDGSLPRPQRQFYRAVTP